MIEKVCCIGQKQYEIMLYCDCQELALFIAPPAAVEESTPSIAAGSVIEKEGGLD